MAPITHSGCVQKQNKLIKTPHEQCQVQLAACRGSEYLPKPNGVPTSLGGLGPGCPGGSIFSGTLFKKKKVLSSFHFIPWSLERVRRCPEGIIIAVPI